MKYLVLCLFALFSICASAVEVTNLYQHTEVVTDKSRSARQQASKDALTMVVAKLTGQTLSDAALRDAKRRISDYLLRYEYKQDEQNGLAITLFFDENRIDSLLNDLSLAKWGSRRPQLVLWLAIEDDWRRQLVTSDTYPQLVELLEANAEKRAIPLIMPLMDLEDRLSLSVTDVWGFFKAPLATASERYGAQEVVAARLYREANASNWTLDWQFLDNKTTPSSLTGERQQLVIALLQDISARLAKRFGIETEKYLASNAVTITVVGAQSFKARTLMLRRLSSLSFIERVTLKSISQSETQVELLLNASKANLEQALELEAQFEKVSDPLSFDMIKPFTYRYLGQ